MVDGDYGDVVDDPVEPIDQVQLHANESEVSLRA
jgi:hypothetical protein